jgi:hypothetical protein
VRSGPCAATEGGRCVGRAGGYGPSEGCAIEVGGGGGALAPACAVFDMDTFHVGSDYVTLPDGSRHGGSDCPAGAVLPPGGAVGWHSDGESQGIGGSGSNNNCGESNRGPCGLPYSSYGIGGGWEICFAA